MNQVNLCVMNSVLDSIFLLGSGLFSPEFISKYLNKLFSPVSRGNVYVSESAG